jgi:hypothetical protein
MPALDPAVSVIAQNRGAKPEVTAEAPGSHGAAPTVRCRFRSDARYATPRSFGRNKLLPEHQCHRGTALWRFDRLQMIARIPVRLRKTNAEYFIQRTASELSMTLIH